MEGWLYGLFTLAGVLAGGLFTYLGLKKQLEQQTGIDEKEWKRKIKSAPLLKLRDELAEMATKGDRLAKRGNDFTVPAKTKEQTNAALQEAISDWNNYIKGDYLTKVLNMQADRDLKELIKEIRKEYVDTYDDVVTFREELSSAELGRASRSAEEEIAPKVVQAQELINKKLEEL
jgi:hypothetical protein